MDKAKAVRVKAHDKVKEDKDNNKDVRVKVVNKAKGDNRQVRRR